MNWEPSGERESEKWDYLQGMGSVGVKPGETKSLQAVVGENFSLEMISLVDSMWGRFEVVGLEVDGLTPPWAIFPYRVEGDTSVNPPLNLCRGQVVKLSVRNVSESSQPFVAGLFGPVSGQKTE